MQRQKDLVGKRISDGKGTPDGRGILVGESILVGIQYTEAHAPVSQKSQPLLLLISRLVSEIIGSAREGINRRDMRTQVRRHQRRRDREILVMGFCEGLACRVGLAQLVHLRVGATRESRGKR